MYFSTLKFRSLILFNDHTDINSKNYNKVKLHHSLWMKGTKLMKSIRMLAIGKTPFSLYKSFLLPTGGENLNLYNIVSLNVCKKKITIGPYVSSQSQPICPKVSKNRKGGKGKERIMKTLEKSALCDVIPTLSLQSIPEIYISAWVMIGKNPMNPKTGIAHHDSQKCFYHCPNWFFFSTILTMARR